MKDKTSKVTIQQNHNNFYNKRIEPYKKTQKHLVIGIFFAICAHILIDIALIPNIVMLAKNRESPLTIIVFLIIMTVISIYIITNSILIIVNSILINDRIKEQIAKEKKNKKTTPLN